MTETISAEAARAARTIKPRSPDLGLDSEIPAYWFGGNAIATHLANGVNLLFPAGERFFVRTVRHFLSAIEDDPVLLEQVKGFFGQEGRHANAHERFFEVMDEQGYDFRGFLAWYEHVAYDIIEPKTSHELRLSVTVALEHFTAIMAENALSDGFLEHAHPALQRLLFWHAAEEIEHKSVAFDVLKRVNPSYALRMSGLAVATTVLLGFWMIAVAKLARQDVGAKRRGTSQELRELRKDKRGGFLRRVFWKGIKQYVRRDFHPSQNDNVPLAEKYLASAGLA